MKNKNNSCKQLEFSIEAFKKRKLCLYFYILKSVISINFLLIFQEFLNQIFLSPQQPIQLQVIIYKSFDRNNLQYNFFLHLKVQITMTQKNQPQLCLNKPQWQWSKINTELKTKIEGRNAKIALKPTMTFYNKNASQSLRPKVRLYVDTEKSLQYENGLGWNWHKSSNLPNITIKLEVKDESSDKIFICPDKLQARIYAVKIVVNTYQRERNAFLEDVGIRGCTKIQMKEGSGYFSGLRFLSTSYNNQGVKFYLLIVVYMKNSQQNLENIFSSVLSPPIFVDSRKSARDYQGKRFHSFVELFSPNIFQKDFIKRESKGNNADSKIKVNNNLDGLFNYLTAPNIRHKVKHPLFLSVKFSNAFKIYFNKTHEISKKKPKINEIICKLQKKLIKEIGGQRRAKKCEDVNKKLFIICLIGTDNGKKQKIMDSIEYLDCKSIFILDGQQSISENFANIDQLGDVVDAYKQQYQFLCKFSSREISARRNKEQKSNQSEEQKAPSEVQKPVKSQEGIKLQRFHSDEESGNDNAQQEDQSQIRSQPKKRRIVNQHQAQQVKKQANIQSQSNVIGNLQSAILMNNLSMGLSQQNLPMQNPTQQNSFGPNFGQQSMMPHPIEQAIHQQMINNINQQAMLNQLSQQPNGGHSFMMKNQNLNNGNSLLGNHLSNNPLGMGQNPHLLGNMPLNHQNFGDNPLSHTIGAINHMNNTVAQQANAIISHALNETLNNYPISMNQNHKQSMKASDIGRVKFHRKQSPTSAKLQRLKMNQQQVDELKTKQITQIMEKINSENEILRKQISNNEALMTKLMIKMQSDMNAKQAGFRQIQYANQNAQRQNNLNLDYKQRKQQDRSYSYEDFL